MTKLLIQIDDEIREMNDDEFALYQIQVEEQKALEKAKAEKEAKRELALSKLAALGLTPDDLTALGL